MYEGKNYKEYSTIIFVMKKVRSRLRALWLSSNDPYLYDRLPG